MSHDANPTAPDGPGRLVSLDALRGLNMFWIVGVDALVPRLAEMDWARPSTGTPGPLQKVAAQFEHVDWAGFHFEDLIFPLFVFIVGVSIVFSLSKSLDAGVRPIARILWRTALLYFLGLLVYRGFDQPMLKIRWLGVLQRIALAYGATSLLFCYFRPRGLAFWAIGLLIGYWALMAFVPVPGVGRGSFEAGRNLANYVDERWLPGRKYEGKPYDPEGILSTLPAIGTCLLGVFAGLLLRSSRFGPYAKVGLLLVGGGALAAAGYAWGFLPSPVQFPVIKKIWTSSFVLLAGGCSAGLLALFYLAVDVWGLRRIATPFVWIGTNAITVYMIVELGLVSAVAVRLVGGGQYKHGDFGAWQPVVTQVVAIVLTFAFARFLYVRRVFIRV